VALVTGGAQRIGAALVRRLHGAGMNVVIHYRHSGAAAGALVDELEQQRADSVVLAQADLADTERLAALVEQAARAWGQLDVLVNNASSFYPTPFAAVSPDQWEDLIGVNLRAPFFLSQAAAPHLAERRGCIVNIADIYGERPLRFYPVYSISQAGLIMLTKALARELGPEIRVNAVAPGAILWPDQELDEATQKRIIARTTLKRRGCPEDIAEAVLFLIGSAEYISGQTLAVDGGRSVYF
jgi:pteridine reductase